jgi:hypothetical protein
MLNSLLISGLISATAVVASMTIPTLPAAACPLPSRSEVSPGPRSMFIAQILSQDEDDSIPDEDTVPTNQVDKYIAVYSAMQKNHSLTVEQAASKEGLTVEQFRTLEDKIERNPVVHERVLDALKASATGTKPPTAGSGKTTK